TNGWARYAGVAQHQVDRPPFKNDPFYYYAHYPLGASYLTWLFFDLGGHELSTLRWPPAICSIAALILWYLLLCRLIGRWSALLSTAVMGTSYGFLAYAANLHHGYSNALVIAMMLCFAGGMAARGRKRLLLLASSWVCVLINAFMSWEWHLWSQMFFWG